MRRTTLRAQFFVLLVGLVFLSGCLTSTPQPTSLIELPFSALQFFITPTRTATITTTPTATNTPHPPYPAPQLYPMPYPPPGTPLAVESPTLTPTDLSSPTPRPTSTPTKTATLIPPPSFTPTPTATPLPAPNQATLAAGDRLPFQVLETGTNNNVYKGKEPKVKVTRWDSGSNKYLIIAVFRGWQPYLELGIEVNSVTRVGDVIIIDTKYTKSQTGIYSAMIAEPFQVIEISAEGMSGAYHFLLVNNGSIYAETTYVVE